MADEIKSALDDYSAGRRRAVRTYDGHGGENKAGRSRWKRGALATLGLRVAQALGHSTVVSGKGMSSPTAKAFAQVASRDEANRVYDAAVATANEKWRGKSTRRWNKAVKTAAKYRDKAVSRLDKAYAAAAGSATTGNPTGTPAGGTGGPPPAPAPSPRTPLAPETGGTANAGAGIATVLLVIGGGILAWKAFKG